MREKLNVDAELLLPGTVRKPVVEPFLPVDVLGIYVFLPGQERSRMNYTGLLQTW